MLLSPSSLVGGYILDFLGRKVTIVVNAVVFILGAIILASAHSYSVLLFGRFVVGFGDDGCDCFPTLRPLLPSQS